jgi:hypothetical protein
MVMHKKPFTVDCDEQLSELFSKQVEERGFTKYRAVEGALRAFIALPKELQVELMNNQISDVSQLIKEKLLDADLLEKMRKLTPEQRNQVVFLAKKAAKIVSPKR